MAAIAPDLVKISLLMELNDKIDKLPKKARVLVFCSICDKIEYDGNDVQVKYTYQGATIPCDSIDVDVIQSILYFVDQQIKKAAAAHVAVA
jgi:hypothetical protein